MPRLLRLHFETVSVMLLRSPDGSRRTSARIPQSRQATGERKSAKAYRYIAVERGERERQSGLKKDRWTALENGVGLFRSGAFGAARIRCPSNNPIASSTARSLVCSNDSQIL